MLKKKVLVCITPQTNSKRLIDKGYEVSNNGEAVLHILHVAKGKNVISQDESVKLLHQLFIYASELGGIIHGLSGEDIYETIKKFINDELITNIVVGEPPAEIPESDNAITARLKRDLPWIEVTILLRECD